MRTFSLQSGSNGNSIYVEANGVRLLFDAGISGLTAERRMALHGRDIRDVDALIISHDHIDHVRCAGVYARKYALPVYMTQRTLEATWCDLGAIPDLRFFNSGDRLEFGHVVVHTIRTPHDAADGVAFVVECDQKRLGILTDLGHPFAGLQELLGEVDGAYLETNYDPRMLERGSYPLHLKSRIRGPGGHLSNHEAAALLKSCGRRRPKWMAVAHLSEDNNHPDLAVAAQHDAVGRTYPVFHASRNRVSEVFEVA